MEPGLLRIQFRAQGCLGANRTVWVANPRSVLGVLHIRG
jgi:hypothetical protein